MSNLLEKASIVTTPTAYDNGKILSVKPAPGLGNEQITNGNFDTDSGWNLGSGITIFGGSANFTGVANANINQSAGLVTGKTYKIVFTVSNYVSGNIDYNVGGNTRQGEISANGTYTVYVVSDSGQLFYFQSDQALGFTGSIDNVSVKQVTDGDFDFTRNSSATRVNSQGLIEDITSNLPRIDYTGGEGHWLFEPQSTNLITYSEDYSNSFYVKDSGVSVGTTNNLSPSINANATKIDVTNNGRIYANIATNTYYTTVFIKSGTFSHFKFAGSNIDLIAETNSNGTIQSFGNGWYRIGKSYTGNRPFQIQAYPDGTYSSHTTSGNYFIWGAQAEVQSFATSIIPTNGSTVTRLQDAAFGAGSSDLINSTEGVLYAEIAALADDLTNKQISLNNGTTDDRIQLYYSTSSNQISVFYKSQSGATAFILNYTLSDITQFNKVAFKWKQNDFALWSNGVEVATQTSGVTSSADTLTKLDFQQFNGSNDFFGKTKCVAVFKEALTDAELTCLTTT